MCRSRIKPASALLTYARDRLEFVFFFAVSSTEDFVPESVSHAKIYVSQAMMNVMVFGEFPKPCIGDAEVVLNVVNGAINEISSQHAASETHDEADLETYGDYVPYQPEKTRGDEPGHSEEHSWRLVMHHVAFVCQSVALVINEAVKRILQKSPTQQT